MNASTENENHSPGIKKKIEEEAKQALTLTVYFSIWFCALTFLAATTLNKHPIPLSMFGIAIIKAGLCAKFMLIAQAIFQLMSKNPMALLNLYF